MSERERWIVYPLLFLALGAALRDKLFDMTTSKRIVCEELTVIDEEPVGLQQPRVLAKIGRADSASPGSPPVGYLFVNGQVKVEGSVVARQILPYGSGILGILPPSVWRAIQQSAQALQGNNPRRPNAPSTQQSDDASTREGASATGSESANEQPSEPTPQ
jgi:hypothetical protein